MREYHKIQTLFKRDANKRLIEGDWTTPDLEYLKDCLWVWDEKIDGTNVRIMYDKGVLRFGGKTDNAQMPVELQRHLYDTFPVSKLDDVFIPNEEGHRPSVCLYGEGCGEKIQKGAAYGSQHFVLFDILIGNIWLRRADVEDVAKKLGIPMVPAIGQGTLEQAIEFTRNGFKSVYAPIEKDAEGLVLRPKVPLLDRMGRRIITKIKTRDFR